MTSSEASHETGQSTGTGQVLPAQRSAERYPQPETPEEQQARQQARQQAAQANQAQRGSGRRKQAKHRIRSRHEKADRRAGVPVKAISVSVPSSVATLWRGHSQRMKRSLVDVVLDAIKANEDRLPEIVRAHQSAARMGRQVVSDGLFLRTAESDDAESDDPYVTVPLRMLSTNVDVLDSLAYKAAAESRSQLVVAALNAYLADSQAEHEARTAHQAQADREADRAQDMLPIS